MSDRPTLDYERKPARPGRRDQPPGWWCRIPFALGLALALGGLGISIDNAGTAWPNPALGALSMMLGGLLIGLGWPRGGERKLADSVAAGNG